MPQHSPSSTRPAPSSHSLRPAAARNAVCCLCLLLLGLAALAPAQAPVFAPEWRPRAGGAGVEATLSGTWEFYPGEASPMGRIHSALRGVPALEPLLLEVPGCYTAQVPEQRWYQGTGWYRVQVDVSSLPADPATHSYVLRFEGVSRQADVFINGTQRPAFEYGAQRSEFAYLPFTVGLAREELESGRLDLVVRVNNQIPAVGIPDREWDGWWNHLGIFREVRLIARPLGALGANVDVRTHLRRRDEGPPGGWLLLVRPTVFWAAQAPLPGDAATFALELPRQAPLPPLRVTTSVAMPAPERPHPRAEVLILRPELRLELPGDVLPWSPAHPNLGTVRVEFPDAVADVADFHHEVRIGLRDVWLEGSQAMYNGRPMRLLGFNYHELHPETGAAMPLEVIEHDMRRMKALGVNFLRAAHYPLHPRVLDLADELGMLVWSEIPAWKTSAESLSSNAVRRFWAPHYLQGMIDRDRHRPSILFWSVGNEFDSTDRRVRDYIEFAVDFVRRQDPSRFAVYASDRRERDISLHLPDVMAVNAYYGWYYGNVNDLGPVLDELHHSHPRKPLMVSEFGHEAIFGMQERAPGARRDYSEPTQARWLRRSIEQIFDPARSHFMMGGAVWLWADFADPHRTEKHHPVEWHYLNMKGVVTGQREPKESFRMLEELIPTLGLYP